MKLAEKDGLNRMRLRSKIKREEPWALNLRSSQVLPVKQPIFMDNLTLQ